MPRWFPPRHSRLVLCAVIGSPIRHSRSPQIHAAFARQFALPLAYERVEVRAGELRAAVDEFRACGGRGLNVTLPLKEEAYAAATRPAPRAAAAAAANTLWFDADGVLAADNTDGLGLVRDLAQLGTVALAGARVLLLGAGGAARGVIPALREAGIAALVLSNRTAARAERLAHDLGPGIDVLGWGEPAAEPFDLVINATSGGLDGEPPRLADAVLAAGPVCYDMVYGRGATPFQRDALARGAGAAHDGLGMLVEQAAAAFERWHGLCPQTIPVTAALRSQVQG